MSIPPSLGTIGLPNQAKVNHSDRDRNPIEDFLIDPAKQEEVTNKYC